jgi:tetratricopeptide (TPR) repeat protein
MGEAELSRGNPDRSITLLEEALPLLRSTEEARWVISALNHLGNAFSRARETTAARRTYEEGLQLAREERAERAIAMITANLGFLALVEGRDDDAEALLQQAAEADLRTGGPSALASTLVNLTLLSLRRDDVATAAEQIAESLALFHSTQVESSLYEALLLGAVVVGLRDDPATSVRLHAAARALADARGYELSTLELELADTALASLPREVVQKEWARGEELDLEAAMTLALESLA